MRVFLAVLVLIFSLQSWTKADDIKDFEIEGMSIGDSLLDYFSEEKIKNFYNYDHLPSDMKYRIIEFNNKEFDKLETFTSMQIYYKPKDKNFVIHSLSVGKFCSTKIKCKNLYKEIKNDLLKSFSKGIEESHTPTDDPTGKSKTTYYEFELNDGYIYVNYFDWSKHVEWEDNVSVEISTKDVDKWNRNNFGIPLN